MVKRILCIILIISSVFSFAACGKNNKHPAVVYGEDVSCPIIDTDNLAVSIVFVNAEKNCLTIKAQNKTKSFIAVEFTDIKINGKKITPKTPGYYKSTVMPKSTFNTTFYFEEGSFTGENDKITFTPVARTVTNIPVFEGKPLTIQLTN